MCSTHSGAVHCSANTTNIQHIDRLAMLSSHQLITRCSALLRRLHRENGLESSCIRLLSLKLRKRDSLDLTSCRAVRDMAYAKPGSPHHPSISDDVGRHYSIYDVNSWSTSGLGCHYTDERSSGLTRLTSDSVRVLAGAPYTASIGQQTTTDILPPKEDSVGLLQDR